MIIELDVQSSITKDKVVIYKTRSFTGKELRSLGDIQLAGSNEQAMYSILINVIPLHTDGDHIGYVQNVIVPTPNKLENYPTKYHYELLNDPVD